MRGWLVAWLVVSRRRSIFFARGRARESICSPSLSFVCLLRAPLLSISISLPTLSPPFSSFPHPPPLAQPSPASGRTSSQTARLAALCLFSRSSSSSSVAPSSLLFSRCIPSCTTPLECNRIRSHSSALQRPQPQRVDRSCSRPRRRVSICLPSRIRRRDRKHIHPRHSTDRCRARTGQQQQQRLDSDRRCSRLRDSRSRSRRPPSFQLSGRSPPSRRRIDRCKQHRVYSRNPSRCSRRRDRCEQRRLLRRRVQQPPSLRARRLIRSSCLPLPLKVFLPAHRRFNFSSIPTVGAPSRSTSNSTHRTIRRQRRADAQEARELQPQLLDSITSEVHLSRATSLDHSASRRRDLQQRRVRRGRHVRRRWRRPAQLPLLALQLLLLARLPLLVSALWPPPLQPLHLLQVHVVRWRVALSLRIPRPR